MRDALTPRQSQIFDFICASIEINRIAPSLEEIRLEFGFCSRSVAQGFVIALEKKGRIHRPLGRHRALNILRPENVIQSQAA